MNLSTDTMNNIKDMELHFLRFGSYSKPSDDDEAITCFDQNKMSPGTLFTTLDKHSLAKAYFISSDKK